MTGTHSLDPKTDPINMDRTRLAGDGETQAFGRAIAAVLKPGDIVLLDGTLGAGKTALARAILRYLANVPDLEVPSPSYTLVNVYDLEWGQVWHADLYRLGGTDELAELGLEDAMGRDLVLIEWPDRLATMPDRHLRITLEHDGDCRLVTLSFAGPGWPVRIVQEGH